MKVNKYIYLLFGLLLTSCNDSFLERYPDTELSDKTYFKTEKDLELYTNTFYNDLPYYYLDYATDNASIYSEPTEIVNMMHGGITPSSVEGWDNWGKLRKYNVLLENVHKTIGNSDNINNYIGIARLMRAQWYYDMVKRYNEVPWYSTSIKDTDVDLLYKKKDSRELVVDSVFADLEYAAKNISTEMKNRTVINKWYAYGLLARIALHEASFRKYHDELKLETSAAAYYEKAIKACEKSWRASCSLSTKPEVQTKLMKICLRTTTYLQALKLFYSRILMINRISNTMHLEEYSVMLVA